jgi:hypothetical protein
MVNHHKDLDQTSAGIQLHSILFEERERYKTQFANLEKDMLEAQQQRDKESQREIQRLQDEKSTEIASLQRQQESLK